MRFPSSPRYFALAIVIGLAITTSGSGGKVTVSKPISDATTTSTRTTESVKIGILDVASVNNGIIAETISDTIDAKDDGDSDSINNVLDSCPNDGLNDVDSDNVCSNEDTCPFDTENDADSDSLCSAEHCDLMQYYSNVHESAVAFTSVCCKYSHRPLVGYRHF